VVTVLCCDRWVGWLERERTILSANSTHSLSFLFTVRGIKLFKCSVHIVWLHAFLGDDTLLLFSQQLQWHLCVLQTAHCSVLLMCDYQEVLRRDVLRPRFLGRILTDLVFARDLVNGKDSENASAAL
jgi:hypothetical protein